MSDDVSAPKRLLMFKVHTFCYNSPFFFIDKTAESFRNAGWEVEVFDGDSRDLQELDEYTGQRFDAILDFNSSLPRADTTEDEYYLDTIEGPFYNYILDHPMYHHDELNAELKNMHIICLDYDHAAYVTKWYPHIKSVHVLPLPGTKSPRDIPFSKRKYDLTFTGTYTDPDIIMSLIEDFGRELTAEMKSLTEIMIEDPDLTMEGAFENIIKGFGKDPVKDAGSFFAGRMHAYFLVSTYVTAVYRKLVVEKAAQSGVPFTVIGHGWEKMKSLTKYANVTVRDPVDFDKTFDIMADSRAVLNVMPWFKNGCHDRIFSAMLNGAVSVTDESAWFSGRLDKGAEYIEYSLKKLDDIPGIIREAFDDRGEMAEIARKGMEKAMNYTWKSNCEALISIFNKTK